MFDISEYTDAELYDILDLNNPSDRVLEAKILMLIHKYQQIDTSSSKKLVVFFDNVYKHFFDIDDADDDDDDNVEGFVNSDFQSNLVDNYTVTDLIEIQRIDGTTSYRDNLTITDINTLNLNETVMVNYESKGLWYRGEITNINIANNLVDIQFINSIPITNDFSDDTYIIENSPINVESGTAQNPYKNQNPPPLPEEKVLQDTSITPQSTDNIIQLDYAAGQLNPLQKQTTTRIISIDSQYRTDKRTMTTDFSFYLSEPLRDVVSLKLYSVHIPYTWYTINNSFGSNFIIFKGKPNGINDGNHDIKFEIESANYDPTTLVSTVNSAISVFKDLYNVNQTIDYDINGTDVTYNPATSLCKFNVNINKIYNTHNFDLFFPSWSSPYPVYDSSDNEITVRNTIPSFLGVQTDTYEFNVIKSLPIFDVVHNSSVSFSPDSTNNFFTVKFYRGTTSYNSSSTVDLSFNIQFSISSGTRSELIADLNTQIQLNPYLTDSYIQFTNIDSRNIGVSNSYIELKIKPNRFSTKLYDDSRVCVIFPNDTTIWLGNSSTFNFDNVNNEFGTILMEINAVEQTEKYTIVNTPKFELTCNLTGFVVTSNDFVITIADSPPADYTKTEYINAINTSIIADISGTNVINNSLASINEDGKFIINLDFTKSFDETSFTTDLSNCLSFITLNNSLYTGTKSNSTIPCVEGEVIATFSTLSPNTATYEIIYNNPNGISGNQTTTNNGVTTTNYTSYINFENDINTIFNQYIDPITNIKMFENTYLSSVPPTQTRHSYLVTLTIGINKVLIPSDYSIKFTDTSPTETESSQDTWVNYLKIDNSMISSVYSLEKPASGNNKTVEFTNDNNITTTEIIYTHNPTDYSISIFGNEEMDDAIILNIQEGINDTIRIVAKDTGVKYSFSTTGTSDFTDNDIVITILPGNYSRDYLIIAMNNAVKKVIADDNTLTKIISGGVGFEYFKLITRPYADDNTILFLQINLYVLRKYTTSDYNLVFYDNTSFVTCYTGVDSVRNTNWDTTLGWILGFRTNTVYDLSTSISGVVDTFVVNEYTKSIRVYGDTGLTTNLYNYFLLCLDDFNQNHLNDGLVTITNNDNSVPLPSYANRTDFNCNPVTGQKEYTNTDGLTDAQIYTLNAINNTKVGGNSIGTSIPSSSYGSGPFVKDVFGLIPVKTNGLSTGSTFVEYGGTLQNQERSYFGPVNIHRMAVKMVSDRGDVVNLNRANWSFALVCEQLNRLKPA
jgi:hypothetical protein